MKKILLFAFAIFFFTQAISQTSMPVNYFQVGNNIYVQTQAVSSTSPLKYYSTLGGGKLLFTQSPNTSGYSEKIFDQDHAPAFVLNSGKVVHLNQKIFIITNLESELNNGNINFTFEASVCDKNNTHFELLKTNTGNGFTLVNSFSCTVNNTNQTFNFSEAPNTNDIYFLRAVSNNNALYTSDAMSGQSANRAYGINTTKENGLILYPTLATQIVTVRISNLNANQCYSIFNSNGQLVKYGIVTSKQFDMDISSLSIGKYIFFTNGSSVSFNKL